MRVLDPRDDEYETGVPSHRQPGGGFPAAADNCCSECKEDEACKIDATGCECWAPGNTEVVQLAYTAGDLGNPHLVAFAAGRHMPPATAASQGRRSTVANGTFWRRLSPGRRLKQERFVTAAVATSGLGAVAGDCCAKCADDEACKVDADGCECWRPTSTASASHCVASAAPYDKAKVTEGIARFNATHSETAQEGRLGLFFVNCLAGESANARVGDGSQDDELPGTGACPSDGTSKGALCIASSPRFNGLGTMVCAECRSGESQCRWAENRTVPDFAGVPIVTTANRSKTITPIFLVSGRTATDDAELPTTDEIPKRAQGLTSIRPIDRVRVDEVQTDDAVPIGTDSVLQEKPLWRCDAEDGLCIRPNPWWLKWILSRQCRKSAVILSGGWSAGGNYQRYYDNVVSYHNKLYALGYRENAIYYGDASDASELASSGDLDGGSATTVDHVVNTKEAMRHEIRKRCALRSPALTRLAVIMSNHGQDNEGLCLWGSNEDGQRYYSPAELIHDLQNCTGSTQIMMLADQCYSGLFTRAIETDAAGAGKRVGKHTCAFAAAHEEEPSWGREYPDIWEDMELNNNCLAESGPASRAVHCGVCGRSCREMDHTGATYDGRRRRRSHRRRATTCAAGQVACSGTNALTSTCMNGGFYQSADKVTTLLSSDRCGHNAAEWDGCPCRVKYPWFLYRFERHQPFWGATTAARSIENAVSRIESLRPPVVAPPVAGLAAQLQNSVNEYRVPQGVAAFDTMLAASRGRHLTQFDSCCSKCTAYEACRRDSNGCDCVAT